MLPAKARAARADHHEIQIHPGSWWRLIREDHPLAQMDAPSHGLILMVETVRVIDGEIHSVVLHHHPMWGNSRPRGGLKFLASDFLSDFVAEPEGGRLREVEIADAMDRVQRISQAMTTPPDPMLLLQEAREKDPEAQEAPAGPSAPAPASAETTLPAALLPDGDVARTQETIETRIAAFEAQKAWITERTEDLKEEMSLVAAYQSEKVNTTLAAISQETSRARNLLDNVRTMRLFLGEDMEVTPLLDGAGADPDEPLTFMQRLLFLDEEIIINDLLEGFSDDQMTPETLSQIFSRDFSLVERMLPYPRCAAIVRVRRDARSLDTSRMDIGELFAALSIAQADERIHILVRDGRRLHMVTADETTSGAERFFPSRQEIEKLFQVRSYRGAESREIVPDNVDYAEARERHDQKALFYKRFLILMWGLHERSDIFGPFMDKGANWLSATTHDAQFRFVHDEENTLTDGRPDVSDFITSLNGAMTQGSRALVYWDKALEGDNAPALCEISHDRRVMKAGVELREDISETLITAEGPVLYGKAPARRRSYGKPPRDFDAKTRLAWPRAVPVEMPDQVPDIRCVAGVLCLDHCRLEDIAYYAENRAARRDYMQFAHLLNLAHDILARDREETSTLAEALDIDAAGIDHDAFETAVRLWRSGNKWRWPETGTALGAILKIARMIANPETVDFIRSQADATCGGVTARGTIFVHCASETYPLHDAADLPWLDELHYSSLRAKKFTRFKTITWSGREKPGQLVLFRDAAREAEFLDRCAPLETIARRGLHDRSTRTVRAWKVPRGLFDIENQQALLEAQSPRTAILDAQRMLEGKDPEEALHWLRETYRAYRAPHSIVETPDLRISLAVVSFVDEDRIPRSWVLNGVLFPEAIAIRDGNGDDLQNILREVYANPDKVFASISSRVILGDLHLRQLSRSGNLSRRWSGALESSFDNTGTRLDAARYPDWRKAIAAAITRPDIAGTNGVGIFQSRTHSEDLLERTAESLRLISTSDALDLASNISRMREAERSR